MRPSRPWGGILQSGTSDSARTQALLERAPNASRSSVAVLPRRVRKYGGAPPLHHSTTRYFAITISIVSSRLCGAFSSASTDGVAVGVSSEAVGWPVTASLALSSLFTRDHVRLLGLLLRHLFGRPRPRRASRRNALQVLIARSPSARVNTPPG